MAAQGPSRPPLPPPHVLASLVDSPAFQELLTIEQKLDWTLLRKRAELNDALGKPSRVKRTLRVFISNTAHNQVNQQNQSALEGAGVGSEETKVPGWVLKIEGRLLDSGNSRLDKSRRKFTTFLKSAIIEMDNRQHPTYPEGSIVEWHAGPSSGAAGAAGPAGTSGIATTSAGPASAALDGFEISRAGDQNVNCRIILHIAHVPDRFRILPPLSDVISLKEGTRAEVMSALWKFVKTSGAQDKQDPSLVKRIPALEALLQQDTPFHKLPEIVSGYLNHPDPVVIPYTIRVDQDVTASPKCWDIPVEIDDPYKSKLAPVLNGQMDETEINELEDKVGELAYWARDMKQKRDFLESFSTNPQAFIQNWLAAQARDLDQMLGYQIGVPGANGGSITEEDLRRSDLFTLPWVDEAIH